LLPLLPYTILLSPSFFFHHSGYHPSLLSFPTRRSSDLFDSYYESSDHFQTVYTKIVHTLLQEAKDQLIYYAVPGHPMLAEKTVQDRKSTRLNSSHVSISYAVFCLKKTIFTASNECG